MLNMPQTMAAASAIIGAAQDGEQVLQAEVVFNQGE